MEGDPKPEVSWRRAKGIISDKDKFQSKYDASTGEYILEVSDYMTSQTVAELKSVVWIQSVHLITCRVKRYLYFKIHKVSAAETDTYKCCAVNEYGKAVCTTTLTVTDSKLFM